MTVMQIALFTTFAASRKEPLAFKATLSLPPSRRAVRGMVHSAELPAQFPIGAPHRRRQIAENLAALVAELDRTFVPAVEAISGPSPEWFEPEKS